MINSAKGGAIIKSTYNSFDSTILLTDKEIINIFLAITAVIKKLFYFKYNSCGSIVIATKPLS